MSARCSTCVFWRVITAGGSFQGQCKRHAPTRDIHLSPRATYVDESSNDARWPLTREENWCGDHESP